MWRFLHLNKMCSIEIRWQGVRTIDTWRSLKFRLCRDVVIRRRRIRPMSWFLHLDKIWSFEIGWQGVRGSVTWELLYFGDLPSGGEGFAPCRDLWTRGIPAKQGWVQSTLPLLLHLLFLLLRRKKNNDFSVVCEINEVTFSRYRLAFFCTLNSTKHLLDLH